MHYLVIVIVPSFCTNFKDACDEVDRILKPFYEKNYDWYQIGARWTGYFDGYDPSKDPKNFKECGYCDEKGKRTGLGKCNVCDGTKKAPLWSTQFRKRAKDKILVSEYLDLITDRKRSAPSILVTQKDGWVERSGDGFLRMLEGSDEKEDKKWFDFVNNILIEHIDDYAVIVDAHN
jgi:hypothetical protein